jgi:hypothetical protein
MFLALGVLCALLIVPVQPSLLRGMLVLFGVEGAAVAGFVLVQVAGAVASGGRLLGRFRGVAASRGARALVDLDGPLATLPA